MGKFLIEYSNDSKQDLIEIKQYIKYNLHQPIIAARFINKIENEVKKTAINPRIYPIIDDELIGKLKIRKRSIKNYILFYQIKDDSIKVVRILYEKRNWRKIL
ncbi:MAG: type II toxin-antitoxin system RelE/ParE family toxin [Clostridia bacterium]|nr:type II toxin-antitoxin system RelE/ParE family toxin [Clostridia bacterium]